MSQSISAAPLLIAEDDEDSYLLTQSALRQTRCVNPIRRVKDGVELMEYLLHRGLYADPSQAPPPLLILLDLNMPRKDGREALKEIKAHPALRQIPVVVLSTSQADEDVEGAYSMGVCSFIRKPAGYAEFVAALKVFQVYWLEVARLPQPGGDV